MRLEGLEIRMGGVLTAMDDADKSVPNGGRWCSLITPSRYDATERGDPVKDGFLWFSLNI